MAIYLYGLVLDRSAHLVPPHITGVGGTPVRVVGCEGLCALVSTLERPPAGASLDDLRAHDHALQAVVHHGATAASVRFGQTFATDDEVRRHVGEMTDRIAAFLETHDDCVEMRLLVVLPDAAVPPTHASQPDDIGPGRAYLERLRSDRDSGNVSGMGLREALGPVVRDERVSRIPNSAGVAFSHLIQRRDEAGYRDAVKALPELGNARIVGPLAFYSFAEPAE